MHDEKPLVSVIVPAYQCADYIQGSVRSALGQTYGNLEVIVVDDGSDDGTRSNIEQITDARLKYIYQENHGAGRARNTGIELARGKYIAFLDSDDLWLPEKLSRQVAVLEKDPRVGLVYCDFASIDEKGDILHENYPLDKGLPRPSGQIFKELFRVCLMQTSTVVVRKEILDEAGYFDEAYRSGQDYDLWLRLSAITEVRYLPMVLAYYRMHQHSLTARALQFREPPAVQILRKSLINFPERRNELSWHIIRKRLSKPYFDYGYMALDNGQFKTARNYFWNSIIWWPLQGKALCYLILASHPSILKLSLRLRRQCSA